MDLDFRHFLILGRTGCIVKAILGSDQTAQGVGPVVFRMPKTVKDCAVDSALAFMTLSVTKSVALVALMGFLPFLRYLAFDWARRLAFETKMA